MYIPTGSIQKQIMKPFYIPSTAKVTSVSDLIKQIDDHIQKYVDDENDIETVQKQEFADFFEGATDWVKEIQFKEKIQDRDFMYSLSKPYSDFKFQFKQLIDQYPVELQQEWKDKFNPIRLEYFNIVKDNHFFVRDNMVDILKEMDIRLNKQDLNAKERKRLANKKYYESHKKEKKEKVLLTEEEKKEHIKVSLKKYYLKKKEMQEPKEPKAPVMKPKMTEEEKKAHRKAVNQKYYEKRKLAVSTQS